MAKFANQKTITIHKPKIVGQFCQVPIDCIYHAMVDLKDSAFKLWLYFASNADNYTFDFSFAHASKCTGISESSRTRAMKELTEKGYLIDLGRNHYNFYLQPDIELPTADPIDIAAIEVDEPTTTITPKYERGKTNISDSLV